MDFRIVFVVSAWALSVMSDQSENTCTQRSLALSVTGKRLDRAPVNAKKAGKKKSLCMPMWFKKLHSHKNAAKKRLSSTALPAPSAAAEVTDDWDATDPTTGLADHTNINKRQVGTAVGSYDRRAPGTGRPPARRVRSAYPPSSECRPPTECPPPPPPKLNPLIGDRRPPVTAVTLPTNSVRPGVYNQFTRWFVKLTTTKSWLPVPPSVGQRSC